MLRNRTIDRPSPDAAPRLLLTVATVAMACLASGTAQGQSEAPEPCRSFSADAVETIHTFAPSADVVALVHEILEVRGLSPDRFVIRAASVENAAAVLCDGEERLLYNPTLFAGLLVDSEWAARAVLAHELGHLLNDHLAVDGEPRERLELEADQLAGSVVCQLGGTLDQAREIFERVGGGGVRPGYPPLSDRLAAVAVGWLDALERHTCPDSVRSGLPSIRLFPNLDGSLVVGGDNVERLALQPVLAAGRIHFEADLTVDRPLILAAESITFEAGTSLRGPKLSLIAGAVEGGTLDVSGSPGEAGGEILIAAIRVVGASLIARGGAGEAGTTGTAGTDGGNGAPGRNGRCGPGVLGEFVGSKAGQPGAPGGDGGHGGDGGDGGDGGRIALLTHERTALFLDTHGGVGGLGGEGGPGGRGGRGGRGGSGCTGLGGNQPTRPNGADGIDGHPGHSGRPGSAGAGGRVWSRPLTGGRELQSLLSGHGTGADDLAAVVRGLEVLLHEPR